jgi:hypothetical protein
MRKMVNLGGSVDCGAIVSKKFWYHFWQETFSAESILRPDPKSDPKSKSVESSTPMGWSDGWAKRSSGANFPEFVYAGFDNQDGEQNVFGPKKKRLEDVTEVAFEPQGQIDWHFEIG